MFLLTVALILQVRHSFPSALEQSSSRALFLIVGIANTASVQYTYDKGNLSSVQRTNNGKSQTYDFTHDDFGNMLTAKVGSRTLTTNVYNNSFDQLVQQTCGNGAKVSYAYDNQGQLLSATGDTTYTYTYDGAGNILTANGHTYTYGDTDWKDLLTGFDGQAIIYDAIGNPTSYYNGTRWNFTWANGRGLATASDGTNSLSFAYDASGLRTSKTVNGTTYRYYYAGGKLMRMTWGTNTIDFFYDASGLPYAMKYNGTAYYYITNLQGDVMHIVNASGTVVASYDYDPYGKVISAAGTLANINPLRYRGYVYDRETGFYYLQSRYYDPTVGRFINADSFMSTGVGILEHGMFTYCCGNPITYSDVQGSRAVALTPTDGGSGAFTASLPQSKKQNIFKIISEVAKAVWKNLDFSFGIGQGLSFEQEILDISVGVGAYGNYGYWSIDHGQYSAGQETYMGISTSVLGLELGAAQRNYREFGQVEYQTDSWVLTNQNQSSITIIGGAYYFLFAGFSYNIGFDPAGFAVDLDSIFNKGRR